MPQSDQNKSANTTSAQQAGQGQMSQPSASSAARAKTNNINPSLSTESESAQSTTNGAQNGQDRDQVGDGEAVVGPSKDPLEGFDWDELDERFAAAMDRFRKEEEDVQEEFREWLKVFAAWAAVTTVHEPDRAHKRLRTRIAWVQGAETSLEEKRLQYVKVVKAFESVVALLNGF